MTSEEIDAEQLLTSHEVGTLLQVNPTSINKWISEGRIPAFRTPGGHRRIRAADLVEFLDTHDMPVPRSLASAARRRLLVVDDDSKHLRAVERWFRPYANRVELALAANGIDALVQVGAFRPHLILLDIFMPDIDGLEVCRRLKANPETTGISIIAVSGRLSRPLEESALGAGALHCMAKPLDFSVVLEQLGVAQLQQG